jgi:thymidine kinase
VVDGQLVREGDTVVVADTVHDSRSVHYEVPCRTHYHSGDLGPEPVGEQLTLD